MNLTAQWLVTNGGSYYWTLQLPDGGMVTNQSGQIVNNDDPPFVVNSLVTLNAPPGQAETGIAITEGGQELPNSDLDFYTFTLYTLDNIDPNAIVWSGLTGYTSPTVTPPEISIISPSILNSQATIDPAFAGNATANLYLDTGNTSFQGVLIGSTSPTPDGQDLYTLSVNLDPVALGLNPATTYYAYFTLNDGFHPLVTSAYSSAINFPAAPLMGTLTETGDGRNNPLQGWTIYIDQNGNGQYDPGEPTDSTNALGQYFFYNNPAANLKFTSGDSYAVGVVLPSSGYQLPGNGSATTTFQYNGGTSTIPLQVQQEITIAGTVFNNIDGTGAPPSQDAMNTSVGGVKVFLDLAGTGVLTANDPQTSTLSDGSFEFVGLSPSTTYIVDYVLPTGFLVSGTAPTVYNVAVGTDPLALYGGNDFAIVGAGVISGTMMGNPLSGGKLGTTTQTESGWTVQITNTATNANTSATTDNNGDYQFGNLAPGTYTVTQQVPAGWRQIAPFTINPSLNPAFYSGGAPIAAIASADFNNDGNLDFAVALVDKNQIDYSLGNGNGTFGTIQSITGLPTGSGTVLAIKDLETGGFNGDGFTDLAALVELNTAASEVVSLLGSPSGLGNATVAYTQKSSLEFIYGIAAGGPFFTTSQSKADNFVVYGFTSTEGISSYFVDTVQYSGGFQTGDRLLIQNVPISSDTPGLHAVAIGDLNNDGNLDLFMNFGATTVAWVAYGQGNGTFGQFGGDGVNVPDLSIPVPYNLGPVALGDLNGDGILDAVTLGANSSTSGQAQVVNVIEQTSVGTWYDLNGNFSSSNNYTLPFDPPTGGPAVLVPQVAIADINGDGLLDIVLVESTTGQLLTYFNLGNSPDGISQFNTSTNIDSKIGSMSFMFTALQNGAQPNGMALGDFNNDGQIDVMLSEPDYQGGGEWLLTNQSQVATTSFTVAPNGQYLVNFVDLQFGQVGGSAFADPNGNGKFDVGEKGLAGITVFVDVNNNGKLDPGEPFTTTNSQGFYAFKGLSPITNASVRVLDSSLLNQRSSPLKSAPLDLSLSAGNSLDFAIAPALVQAIADQAIVVGQSVSLPVLLTPGVKQHDPKRPGELVFTLDSTAPAGMTINPATGILTWTPTSSQLGIFPITVRVRDTQNPLDDDSTTFNLTVQPPIVVVAGGTIGGVVFSDANADGVKSAADAGIGGRVVYLDANNYGKFDFGETSTTTAVDGSYSFTNLNPGGYVVRELLPNSQVLQTAPAGGTFEVALPSGSSQTNLNFGTITISTFIPITPQQAIFPAGQTGFTAYVNGVYRNLLGRNADPSGQAFWVGALNAGLSRTEMALSVLQSREYRGIELDGHYRTFLGRTESQADQTFWVNAMVGGVTEQQLVLTFLSSAEYQSLHSTNTEFVQSLYRNVLSREPDSGLAFWTNSLATGSSRASVAKSFTDPILTSEAMVDAFYTALLHRAPDAAGQTFWENFLEQGGTIDVAAEAFLGSDEYFGNIGMQ